MSRVIIKGLVSEYLKLGGSQKFVDSLPSGYSISVEARLRSELRKLKKTTVANKVAFVPNEIQKTDNEGSNGISIAALKKEETAFSDLISEYPVSLHSVYLARKTQFLKACSLKIQLNELPPAQEKEAFDLQWQIWKCFATVDDATYKLNYWKENRRVLEDGPTEDFSGLSQSELVQRRNTLRSNASNRSRTILKMEDKLSCLQEKGENGKQNTLKIQDKLLKKREQLRQIQLQIEVLDGMIKK